MYIKGVLMFCLNVVVAHRCVLSIDVFLRGSSWSFIEVVCVLLACGYVIAFLLCLHPLFLGEVLCLVCGDCEPEDGSIT
jgi:hypothetical protein